MVVVGAFFGLSNSFLKKGGNITMATTINLDFEGYWREVNKGGIPSKSGVYLVYVCRHNKSESTVTLDRLIYIGEAEDVQDRIANHEKWPKWRQSVPKGSEICFSVAGVTSPDRERAEATLIYYHNPPCNDEYKDSFPFEETTVKSTEQCALLSSLITVSPTP
jgi:excinuclease UvrABC nuclease subunit